MTLQKTYKNRLLGEYQRDELENDFLANCETLDKKAIEIVKLEQKAQHLSQRLSKLTSDLKDKSKVTRRFIGSQAPTAFRQSQMTVKELQNQVQELERDIEIRKKEHEKILRQISYFQNIQSATDTVKPKISQTLAKSGIVKGIRTKEEIINMLQMLLERSSVPQMKNRIKASIAILKGNYEAAEAPMKPILDSVGESTSLKECIMHRNEITEREAKIEALKDKLSELKNRFTNIQKKQKIMTKQYQEEAEQNAGRNKEILMLQQEKDLKQSEIVKISELHLIADNLRSEIEQLKHQKMKLQSETEGRESLVRGQVTAALEKLRNEVKAVESRCLEVKENNGSLEKRLAELEKQSAELLKKRRDAEEQFDNLQRQYADAAGTYGKMIDNSENDPFDDRRFVAFISRMKEKKWTPDTIREMTRETEMLTQKLHDTKTKIAQYEDSESQLNEKISIKRKKITELEEQLRELAEDLSQSKVSERKLPEFTPQSQNAKLTEEEQKSIEGDRVAISLYFGDYDLDPSVIGNKASNIFLVVEFLDHEPVETQHIEINKSKFGEKMVFYINNDSILKQYIQNTSVPVKLCRDRDGVITEIARTELNLMPFLIDSLSITCNCKFWNNKGRPVGNCTFEAFVSGSLYSEE